MCIKHTNNTLILLRVFAHHNLPTAVCCLKFAAIYSTNLPRYDHKMSVTPLVFYAVWYLFQQSANERSEWKNSTFSHTKVMLLKLSLQSNFANVWKWLRSHRKVKTTTVAEKVKLCLYTQWHTQQAEIQFYPFAVLALYEHQWSASCPTTLPRVPRKQRVGWIPELGEISCQCLESNPGPPSPWPRHYTAYTILPLTQNYNHDVFQLNLIQLGHVKILPVGISHKLIWKALHVLEFYRSATSLTSGTLVLMPDMPGQLQMEKTGHSAALTKPERN